jgi:hypothetical protein
LPRAIPCHRSNRKPIRLCQRHCFIRFHLRSKTGQGDNGGTQDEHYRQGRERFDHGGS